MKGSQPVVKYEHKRRDKYCVMGALNSDHFIYELSDKEHLHVEYFPSYSPELDPIEQSWRETKKWLAIRNWNNKADLKEQLISAFQQDFL